MEVADAGKTALVQASPTDKRFVVYNIMAVHDHMLQVCSRLFRQKVSNPIPLKRLGIINVEEFKQHGYLVVDNFITKEVASSIREEALRIKQKGAQELSSLPLGLLITFCVFVLLILTC